MGDIIFPDGTTLATYARRGTTKNNSSVLFDLTYGMGWNLASQYINCLTNGNMQIVADAASGDTIDMYPDDYVGVTGGLYISGLLYKGSGSCLTTDIFYNGGGIEIVRGMVCVSGGMTLGDRVYSKPISSCVPCSVANDKRVVGAKVIEDISHTEMNKQEFAEAIKLVKGKPVPAFTKPLKNTSTANEKINKKVKTNIAEIELTQKEFEVLSNAAKSKYMERLHIGILGQYSKVLVDSDITPIENGDMLTTSTTIGHGMKSTELIPGTMFGKALQDMANGKGYIRCLLGLQ